MTALSRAPIRTLLYQLLVANVTGAQRIVEGFTDDLAGESPVVVIASAGTSRPRLSLRGAQPKVTLDVYVFALAATGADDILDSIEQQIAQVVDANQVTARWLAVDYAADTEVGFIVALDGAEYRRERIPLAFTAR